jgi:hypothetical protein
LFTHFDKLNVAWYLSCQFSDKHDRNRHIKTIVEPPPDSKRSSPLLQELKRLPFQDIVTTNYDSNIKHFFDPDNRMLTEVTCTKHLLSAFVGSNTPRLFYLHGKVDESDLILDRFDYAQLLAERDGILDYVTFLLRNSHVIYIGFALDDPSFNLVETRLNTSSEAKDRPESFALLPHATDGERQVWLSRRLNVIDYGDDHLLLPELFACLNRLRDFVQYAEPDRPLNTDPQADRTGLYLSDAARNYVLGEFAKSILKYRAALGSTVLWERTQKNDYAKPERAEIVVDILIRLAQSHYKLRWSTQSDKCAEDQSLRAERNLQDAERILRRVKPRHGGRAGRAAILALKNSIRVLRARITYHDGKFAKARRIYSSVVRDTRQGASDLRLPSKTVDVWKIKLGEAYYYAQCQISRIDYQVRPDRCGWRLEQIDVLKNVRERVRDLCTRIADSKRGFSRDAERDHYLSSFATILRIAQWTEGRLAISVFGDLLPIGEERIQGGDRILAGVNLLEEDPWEQLCKLGASLKDKAAWSAPTRWLAMRYRYIARGRAMLWMLEDQAKPARPASNLVIAYEYIQRAMVQTRGGDLERQEMLNLLEAARIAVFVVFSERTIYSSAAAGIGSFSRAAALYHLDQAFEMIERLKASTDDQWHCVLAHRLASYFGLLVSPISGDQLEGVRSQPLLRFLCLSVDGMKSEVISQYNEFAHTSGESSLLKERVRSYQRTFEGLQGELEGSLSVT